MEIKKRVTHVKTILLVSLAVIVVLAIVFVFTLPGLIPGKKFEEMTPAEKIIYVEEQENKTNDKTHYDAAKLFSDRKYCQYILDEGLKRRCISETPEPTPVPTETPAPVLSEQEQADREYYDAAKLFEDKKYCEFIVDEEMKTECLSVVD